MLSLLRSLLENSSLSQIPLFCCSRSDPLRFSPAFVRRQYGILSRESFMDSHVTSVGILGCRATTSHQRQEQRQQEHHHCWCLLRVPPPPCVHLCLGPSILSLVLCIVDRCTNTTLSPTTKVFMSLQMSVSNELSERRGMRRSGRSPPRHKLLGQG